MGRDVLRQGSSWHLQLCPEVLLAGGSLYISKGMVGDVFQRPPATERGMLLCGDQVSRRAARALSLLTYSSKLHHEREQRSTGKHQCVSDTALEKGCKHQRLQKEIKILGILNSYLR